MDNIETLKQKIEALEIQISEERIKHEKELQKIKTENYDALEALSLIHISEPTRPY